MNYYYIGLLRSTELGLVEILNNRQTNYRRVEITPMEWYFEDEDDTILNAVEIEFPVALNNWERITHFGFFDSLQGGNLIVLGILQETRYTIEEGYVAKFDVGKIKVENFVEELGINVDG